MSIKETKREIGQLKDQMKNTHKKNDFRLLKMTFILVILTIIAAFLTGRLQLW